MKKIAKRIPVWTIILFSLFAGMKEIYASIPDKIYLDTNTETVSDKLRLGNMIQLSDTIIVSTNKSYTLECSFLGIIPLKEIQVYDAKEEQLAIGGKNIGVYMNYDGILVIDVQEIESKDGTMLSPSEKKLKKGDYIKAINGKLVHTKEELVDCVSKSEGKAITISFVRNDIKKEVEITPVCAKDESYKLGVWVRDDSQGIGTITFIDKEGHFGALGHGVTDMDGNNLINIKNGELYTSKILSIKRGEEGAPGELSGAIIYNEKEKIGIIDKNTERGIFGNMDTEDISQYVEEWYDISYKEDIYPGKATICCSTGDGVETYDIEIEEITLNSDIINKNFIFRVTDEALIEKTGGIVQGLSGSPIIQDGKLVGAVTHVLVNDPTRGYGIFIENMLDAAS